MKHNYVVIGGKMNEKILLKSMLCLLFIMNAFLLIAAIPAEERAALIEFYKSTNGDQWKSNEGWKMEPLYSDGFAMPGTEEFWKGLYVAGDDFGAHVRRITLDNNNLTGTIPTGLNKLVFLDTLDLSENHLSGAIPVELCTLSQLQMLRLNNNSLSGTIPVEMGNMKNLKRISLYFNQLTGTIPKELGNLEFLERLSLYNNQLTGTIPAELGNMKNLQRLLLMNNQLSGTIPRELGRLIDLRELYLNNNQLTGPIPPELGNPDYLHFFSLANNQLTGAIPKELGNLASMQEFYLDNNQLSGTIPKEMAGLRSVEILNLANNQLSGSIPFRFVEMEHLEELYLENNNLSGSLFPDCINWKELKKLSISNNHFSGSIPSELGNLPKLEFLNLSRNLFNGTIPSSFLNLSSLTLLDIGYNCLSVTDPAVLAWLNQYDRDWNLNQDQCAAGKPIIHLNRSVLRFNALDKTNLVFSQTVLIENHGSGVLNWTISSDSPWLTVSPASGKGNTFVTITVNTEGLELFEYTGTLMISDPNAVNSPVSLNVVMSVYGGEIAAPPFGEFSTPLNGAKVCNSIAVTGWAIDDIGVKSVKIYIDDIYTGDAVFVEGARQDIEALYRRCPNSYKAGWGYMLLTQTLPNGGNGKYTLVAKATDFEGQETILGSKTITVDNAHSVKPFGAIDTPDQGGIVSGKEYVNSGWVLTPLPNQIPTDGSSIDVFVDSVKRGQANYNILRSDIAGLFPGYANTNGAGGYYFLDTTTLKNGVHTISWNVTDSAGNTDGIGSRYFTVMNEDASGVTGTDSNLSSQNQASSQNQDEAFYWNDTDATTIEIKELQLIQFSVADYLGFPRSTKKMLEIEVKKICGNEDKRNSLTLTTDTGTPRSGQTQITDTDTNIAASNLITGYMVVGTELKDLPIGSTLDNNSGTFYWQPGPGFIGEYRFVFVGRDEAGNIANVCVIIRVNPMNGYGDTDEKLDKKQENQ